MWSGRINIAGAGINMAQRVMDSGDAGHILVSQHARRMIWCNTGNGPRALRDLAACEVKAFVGCEL